MKCFSSFSFHHDPFIVRKRTNTNSFRFAYTTSAQLNQSKRLSTFEAKLNAHKPRGTEKEKRENDLHARDPMLKRTRDISREEESGSFEMNCSLSLSLFFSSFFAARAHTLRPRAVVSWGAIFVLLILIHSFEKKKKKTRSSSFFYLNEIIGILYRCYDGELEWFDNLLYYLYFLVNIYV